MPPFHCVVSKALKRFEHVSFFFIFLLFLAFFVQLLLRFFVQCFSAYFLFIMTKGSSRNAFEVLCRRQRAGEREKGQRQGGQVAKGAVHWPRHAMRVFCVCLSNRPGAACRFCSFSFFIFLLLLLVLPSFSASFSASTCACCFGFSFVLAVWLCG